MSSPSNATSSHVASSSNSATARLRSGNLARRTRNHADVGSSLRLTDLSCQCRLNTNSGFRHFDWNCPFHIAPSWSPSTGLPELSMSRPMTFDRRCANTALIQWPERSARAPKFSAWFGVAVSNRPMALANTAPRFTARPPISWRIPGSRQSRSASLTSS